jgi:hypothetical protein
MRTLCVSGLLFAACGGTARAPATAHGRAAAPDRAPQPYAPLFERVAGHLLARPVFTPDGGIVVAPYRFDQAGRFIGFASFYGPGGEVLTRWMSVLPDGRGIQYATGGDGPELVVGSLERTLQHADVRVSTAREGTLGALSPAGDRFVGVEGDELIVRRLADLAIERRLRVGDPDEVAITSAGDVVFTDLRRLVRARSDGQKVTLAEGVVAAAISDDSDVAVVADREGRLRVIPIGDAKPPAPVPGDGGAAGGAQVPAGDPDVTLAVAANGRRIAAVTCKRLLAWAARGDEWQKVLDEPVPGVDPHGQECFSGKLTFDRDGSRLALTGSTLVVYGEGVPHPEVPAAHYPVTPPPGFEGRALRPADIYDDVVTSGAAGLPRDVASFETADGAVTVHVVAHDAREIGGTRDLTAWAKLAMHRYDEELGWNEEDGRPVHLRAWVDDAGRRTVEYSRFPREGCDPKDVYVHITEDGAILYRVWVVAGPGLPIAKVLPAFFDAPFRSHAPPGERLAGAVLARGGC